MKVLLVGLALAAVSLPSAAADDVEIRTQRDKTFSFKGVQTWRWHPDGPGSVRMMSSTLDDPDAVRKELEPVVVSAVEREMAARGLTQADGPADLHVNYYLLVTPATSSTEVGQFLPSVTEYGLPPFPRATTRLRAFEQGSLVIDVVSPPLKSVVWRGIAQAEIQRKFSEAERHARIAKAVHDIVAKLPDK